MGIINFDINSELKRIEKLTKQEVADKIISEAKIFETVISKGNYSSLVKYFKGNEFLSSFFAQFLCVLEYDKAVILFDKILDVFDIRNIDKKMNWTIL